MILIQRRSIEDPRNSIADWDESSGLLADTGQRIDRRKALQYSPVWRAVFVVASTIGKIPCRVYRRTAGGKERAADHPAYNLIRYKPNERQTAFYFFQTALAQCLLEPGNAYSYIYRGGRGEPVDIVPLDPRAVCPVIADGELQYVYYDPNGVGIRRFDRTQVLHFRGPGWDGLQGYSVLEFARNSIGMGSAAQKYSNKYFANSGEARVVLEYPTWLDQEKADATLKMWNAMHGGLDNQHKTALLQGGMKASQISISARDSQLIETLNWSIKDVANWFGVPPHKLGDTSRAAYNSLEQENQSFLDDTIDPWLVMMEQEMRDKLLTGGEQMADSHVIEFDRAALVRANLSARAEYYSKGLSGHPWLAVDEVRNLENMNGVGIDEIRAPSNNFQPTEPAAPARALPVIPAVNAEAVAAASEAVGDIEARMVKRLDYNYDKALKKPGQADRAAVFGQVCSEHDAVMREALLPAVRTLCALTGEDVREEAERRIKAIHAEVMQ